jgi:electron transfer flavoprotein beta subunit
MVAQFLGIPHASGIVKLDVVDGRAMADSLIEGGKESVEIPLPAVFTAQKGLNEPRVPLITGVMKAMIPRIAPQELGVLADEIGASGSKVRVEKYLPPKKRSKVRMIAGEAPEAAAVHILVEVERVV